MPRTCSHVLRRWLCPLALAIAVSLPCPGARAQTAPPSTSYAWSHEHTAAADTVRQRLAPPAGFQRLDAAPGSFAHWLRGLPLKPAGSPVLLHTGKPKYSQNSHAAVIDIDTGPRDLQQCADAIMRLRAEWLFSAHRHDEIAFDYTVSDVASRRVAFSRWAKGERPKPGRTSVGWSGGAKPDASYPSFRRYLDQVFAYAGTASLSAELKPRALAQMQIGDVWIKGGFPGHAVLVIDMGKHATTGETRFLLAQSFMPAQDIHILKDPSAKDGAPWYRLDAQADLWTPDWTFTKDQLKHWP